MATVPTAGRARRGVPERRGASKREGMGDLAAPPGNSGTRLRRPGGVATMRLFPHGEGVLAEPRLSEEPGGQRDDARADRARRRGDRSRSRGGRRADRQHLRLHRRRQAGIRRRHLGARQAQGSRIRRKRLVVTGCLVQRYGGELQESLPEVDAFLGTGDFTRLPGGARRTVSPTPRPTAAPRICFRT